MPLQNRYRGIPEPNLANFDWFDLATGTGYKTFYGMDLIEGSNSLAYVFSTQTLYSSVGFKSFSNALGEINFDLTFEVPLTVEGNVLLNIAVGSEQAWTQTLTFILYHVDTDNTETQLDSTTDSVTVNNNHAMLAIKFEVPVRRFKAGEKLRLSLNSPAVGAGKAIYWLFDPKNRSTLSPVPDFINSQLILNLPIKI